MINNRTPQEVLRYDLFKLVVALALVLTLAVLLFIGGRLARTPAAPLPPTATPATVPTVAAPTQPPPTAVPTAESPTPAESGSQTGEAAISPAPTIALPDMSSFTGGDLPLSGTGQPNVALQIIVDGQVVGTVTTGSDGAWSALVPLDGPGPHTIEVQQVAASDVASVVVAPEQGMALQITRPVDGAQVDVGMVDVAGMAPPDVQVRVFVDGQQTNLVNVDGGGLWQVNIMMLTGPHTLRIELRDQSDQSKTISIQVVMPDGLRGCSTGRQEGDQYVVGVCQTMSIIARDVGVSLDSLIAANPQVPDPDVIYPGQTLAVPTAAP